jgi:hypothetical protein
MANTVRGITYAALAIGAALTLWIPSQVLVGVGGPGTDWAFAGFLSVAAAVCAFAAFRDRPLLEYTVIPLAVTAFVVYGVCSFLAEKYGMGLVVSAHAGWFVARYVTIREEIREFGKETP